jgi:hypothetical protein
MMSRADAWLVGVDSMGQQIFDSSLGGSNYDTNPVLQKVGNKVFCAITSNSADDGNKTVPNVGTLSDDIWLVELDFAISVEKVAQQDELKAYPNPAQTVLNFSLPIAISSAKVSLINMNGQVERDQQVIGASSASINVSGLAKGVYTLQVKAAEYTYNRKVIIN